MKAAIMGAGISGLACAITLEKLGVQPVIFENRSRAGDRFVNGEILLSALNRPVNDCIAYFSEEFQIYLKPVGNIRKVVVYSENERAVIEGHLGFSNIRGRNPNSFESQLGQQVTSEIHYNSSHTYEQLLQEYTHVVLATGDAAYAARIQNFQEDLTVTLKGATVEGDFNLFTVYAWLDYRLTPKGYGWLIPISEKEASVVIGYPDYPENREPSPEVLWERFYERVRRDLGQDLKIVDRFEVNRYIFGLSERPRVGNTFFVGNCFGSIMPFLGFGQFPALLTGIYAAYDLCGKGHYEELTRPLRKSYYKGLSLRRALEKMDNPKLDIMVKGMDTHWGGKVLNSSFDYLKWIGLFLKPLVASEGRRV